MTQTAAGIRRNKGLVDARVLSVHQRVGFRRSSGQGLRPDLRRDRRSVLPRRPEGRHRPLGDPRGLRNARHHQQGRDRRRDPRSAKSVTNDQIESVVRAAIKDIGYEQDGFHWKNADIEILLHPQSADIAQGVDALQPGDQRGRGRRRPGHHVRLRHQRDAGPDAGADLLRAQDPAADLGSAPLRQGEGAGPGLQEPGHRAVRERQAGRRARDRGLAPASRRGHDLERRCASVVEPYVREALPEGWINGKTDLAHQSDRQVLHRRSRRRLPA